MYDMSAIPHCKLPCRLFLPLTDRLFTIHPHPNLATHSSLFYFCHWEINFFNSLGGVFVCCDDDDDDDDLNDDDDGDDDNEAEREIEGEKRSCSSCFRKRPPDAASGALHTTSQTHHHHEEGGRYDGEQHLGT